MRGFTSGFPLNRRRAIHAAWNELVESEPRIDGGIQADTKERVCGSKRNQSADYPFARYFSDHGVAHAKLSLMLFMFCTPSVSSHSRSALSPPRTNHANAILPSRTPAQNPTIIGRPRHKREQGLAKCRDY